MDETVEQAGENRRIDQIVELAAQGWTDKQIAHDLGISAHTVGTHWRRLRERTGASNRTAAVLGCLRARIEEQNKQLREANEELLKSHDASRKGMNSLLTGAQRKLVEVIGHNKQSAHFERASQAARIVTYELESIDPVFYRYLSLSAQLFGIDVPSFMQGSRTFYDLIYPEDLPLLCEQSLGATWEPNERYAFLYRIQMPEPRWILDIHQALYDEEGSFAGVVGMAVDVHELVLAGIIAHVVTRLVVPSPTLHNL
jgi:DNA-binding CsgD family transcriptional regulator